MKNEYEDNLRYVACKIRAEFAQIGYSEETIADMLVEYLYGRNRRYKQLLWFCYGQYIVNNLEKNIGVKKAKFIQCIDCGEWIEVEWTNNRTHRCSDCQTQYTRNLKTKKQREYRKS